MIVNLSSHIHDSKSLKQNQWKNIIKYDSIKDKEKRRLNDCIHYEAELQKLMITKLHQEIKSRDQLVDEKDL